MSKIAYTGSGSPEPVRRELARFMEGKGYPMDMLQLGLKPPRDAYEQKEMLKGYEVIISLGEQYSDRCLRYLSDDLRLLSRHGVGIDEISLDTATELGIAVCNAKGTLSACVAECALSLILMALHQYPALDRGVRAGDWNQEAFSSELSGKVIGLVGFGDIARGLAGLLSGFRCRILAYDPYFNEAAGRRLGVAACTLDALLAEADVVSLHTPLTGQTQGMVDAAFLAKMKPSAILVNTSRGRLVVERDLADALRAETIAAAGLDCTEQEPIAQDSPLLELGNVILLPHVAAHTYEGQLRAGLMACQNAIDFLEGRAPASLCNPGYRGHAHRAAEVLA